MKINNNKLIPMTKNIELREGVKVLVTALPIGWERKFLEIAPEPVPPVKVVNHSGGKREEIFNVHAPDYVKLSDEHTHLKVVYMFWVAVSRDTSVVFDNIPTDLESLRKLSEEIASSGISGGELAKVFDVVHKMNTISTDQIKEAKESF